MTVEPESVTHVLYHAHCADGFGAAYAAWLVLGDSAVYRPVRHGEDPPKLPRSARVAIVDFCYPREVLLKLRDRVEDLVVLDHHKSAEADIDGLEFAIFDMDKSGARMAWEFWHPQRRIPELLEYIEDRDLWRWELEESKEVTTALHTKPHKFKIWHKLSVADLVVEGRSILHYQETQVSRAVRKAHFRELAGYTIPVVNSCLLQSEIGHELCRRHSEAPFSGVYYTNADEKEAWSLRSIGEFDVSEVARRFGGGGHRNSAGFARDLPPR